MIRYTLLVHGLTLGAALTLAACTGPRPEHIAAAMAPVGYVTAAETLLAKLQGVPLTAAQLAAIKAADQAAFDRLGIVMDAQAERVRALHAKVQELD